MTGPGSVSVHAPYGQDRDRPALPGTPPAVTSRPRPTPAVTRPAVAATGAVVTVTDATVRVGGRTVWSHVSLQVTAGEFVAVLGPNGVGKSTLLKAVLGLVPVSAGQVQVLGARPGRHNARIGYLPQRRAFDPATRIRGLDIVRLGLDGDRWGFPLPARLRGRRGREDQDRVAEVVDLVGATGYARRPIGQCSGGEQQRLLIAQALVRRPELLILDEPLDSLDVTNQASVSALIQRICRSQQVAVMLVAHDVNPILTYLDQVVYLAHGGALMGSPRRGDHVGHPHHAVRHPGRRAAGPRRSAGRGGPAGRPVRTPARPGGLTAMEYGLTWNLLDDVRQLFDFHFMVNALRAGTVVAVVAGAVGWFVVLRRQAYAGHTLAVIGFPGAAGATWLGISPVYGYFGFCILGALVIAALPGGGPATGVGGHGEQSAVIGSVRAFALACGFLFVSLYKGFLTGLNSLLFGTITGVSDSQVRTLVLAGAVSLAGLAVLGRPLLFASVDPGVARARGVPVRLVSAAFLLLLGVAAAGTSQVTGSLLVFALLVAPAAAAARLTARPALGLVLSVLIALAVTWVGEGIAYFSPYPIGFWVTSLAFVVFLLSAGCRLVLDRSGRRHDRTRAPAGAAGSAALRAA